jgi:hypothetical protein
MEALGERPMVMRDRLLTAPRSQRPRLELSHSASFHITGSAPTGPKLN